jgi:hypothetical protein
MVQQQQIAVLMRMVAMLTCVADLVEHHSSVATQVVHVSFSGTLLHLQVMEQYVAAK